MGIFVDVNKENYMKALFMDLEKTAKAKIADASQLIHDFVVGNPTNDVNDNTGREILPNGLVRLNGRILIKATGLLKK